MRRPTRRRVSVKVSADGGTVELRANDKVLGEIARLETHTDQLMSGAFSHSPAYADYGPLFLQLARAREAGDTVAAASLRERLEQQGVEVWHNSYEMRIDRPLSLEVGDGKVHFAPNDAFLMMRTGGL